MKRTAISLFSGAGGLDLGFEKAGFDTKLAIEIDADCRKTLARNRPTWNATEVHGGDVRAFKPKEILRLAGLSLGELDVVVGGPPCQSFSNIGKRLGLGDERGSLIHSYLDIVKALRPRFFVFENVQGLLQHQEVFDAIGASLERRYSIGVRLLNAADFGVPQIRRRVIILGRLGNAAPQFPAETHRDPSSGGKLPVWRTVRDALAPISPEHYLRADNFHMKHSREMVERMMLIKPGENFHQLPMELRPDCWKNGRHQGADTFGRLAWDKPSVTIRTCGFNPTKGRYIHPELNRGLSTIEMAALQTFPLSWHFEGKIGSIGRQIGNAVPPALGAALGEAIMSQLNECKWDQALSA